jgi:hypothetical protein
MAVKRDVSPQLATLRILALVELRDWQKLTPPSELH